jgi:hypothetical protein
MAMRNLYWRAGAAALVAFLGAFPVLAGDEPNGQKPEMSAQEKAMMDAMMKAGTPGPQHQWLASKAGSWTFAGKFWMSPEKPPMESTGTVERTAMWDGRVLAETVKSEMMGMPFEGHGMSGYDNVKKEFWGTWNDNMSTGLMVSSGTCDDKGNCTFKSTYTDPMTGESRESRMTSRSEGSDKEVMEAFDKGPDGKEYKSMELVYTRKK